MIALKAQKGAISDSPPLKEKYIRSTRWKAGKAQWVRTCLGYPLSRSPTSHTNSGMQRRGNYLSPRFALPRFIEPSSGTDSLQIGLQLAPKITRVGWCSVQRERAVRTSLLRLSRLLQPPATASQLCEQTSLSRLPLMWKNDQ